MRESTVLSSNKINKIHQDITLVVLFRLHISRTLKNILKWNTIIK